MTDDRREKTVIVKKGHLPIIVAAPHGGLWKPECIPDRQKGTSPMLADMHTQKIAMSIGLGLQEHYHTSPHVIINKISRRKVDVNRSVEEGAESESGECVWNDYHGCVKEAVESVLSDYGHGLLIDIHGQTHSHERVELGYLLEYADLICPDILEDRILQHSSIQSLARRHLSIQPTHLLKYFGNIMMTQGDIQVVPSTVHPIPDEVFYFSGGYTTECYGSILDVIQIEIPRSLRFTEEGRSVIVKAILHASIQMIDNYYIMKSRM